MEPTEVSKTLVSQISSEIQRLLNRADSLWSSWIYASSDDPYRDQDELIALECIVDAWRLLEALSELTNIESLVRYCREQREEALSENNQLQSLQTAEGEPYLLRVQEGFRMLSLLKAALPVSEPHSAEASTELLSVINNSEFMLVDRRIWGWMPTDERDVHERLYALLKCVYPDAQNKPRLTRPIKNYEPDVGIASQKTLIEFKFINDESNAKGVLDQIFTDIVAYDEDDFNQFIFVVYETNRVAAETDWRRALPEVSQSNKIHFELLKGTPFSQDDRNKCLQHREALRKRSEKALDQRKKSNLGK